MYDIFTTAYLFFLLVPGLLITLPPGANILTAAAVHAIIFFFILQYLSLYVPWWGIWLVGVPIVSYKVLYGGSA
jgi:hypothetical protein